MDTKWLTPTNRILLGLLMFVPGIMKLFVTTPAGVAGFFGTLNIPIPSVAAWIVIIAEIVTGIMIIVNWQVKWAVIPPIIILLVAALLTSVAKLPASASTLLFHLIAVVGYMMLGAKAAAGSTKKSASAKK